MVLYYGYYSNKARGKGKNEVEQEIKVVNSAVGRKASSRNWALLLQKIHKVDPLECQKCGGKMRIIEFVEDGGLIHCSY